MESQKSKKEDDSCLMIDTRAKIVFWDLFHFVLYLWGTGPAAMWDGSGKKGKERKIAKVCALPPCHLLKRGKILKLFENTSVAWTLD